MAARELSLCCPSRLAHSIHTATVLIVSRVRSTEVQYGAVKGQEIWILSMVETESVRDPCDHWLVLTRNRCTLRCVIDFDRFPLSHRCSNAHPNCCIPPRLDSDRKRDDIRLIHPKLRSKWFVAFVSVIYQ